MDEHQRDWDEWIPYILMAYRNQVHIATGETSLFLLHGRDMVFPYNDLLKLDGHCYDYDENYHSELVRRLQLAYEMAKENLERNASNQVVQYNKKAKEVTLAPGDKVLLYNSAVMVGTSKKLAKPWTGPYRILEKIGNVTFYVQEIGTRKTQIVHANRLKRHRGLDEEDIGENVTTRNVRKVDRDFEREEDITRNQQRLLF